MIRQIRKTISRENLPSPGYTSREVVVKIWGTGLRSPSQNISIKKERRRKKREALNQDSAPVRLVA